MAGSRQRAAGRGVDFVVGGAHTILLAFPDWEGAKLAVTLSQGTPGLLVFRASLSARRGDVAAVKGLRIGTVRGPDRALLHLLRESGVDPARDSIVIARLPGAPGASFGVLDADALEDGLVDGFWACSRHPSRTRTSSVSRFCSLWG